MGSCFIIGLYAAATFKYNDPIELNRWLIISLIGLIFLIAYINRDNQD